MNYRSWEEEIFLEVNFNDNKSIEALENASQAEDVIEVKAHLSCPYCGFNKTFKNRFKRSNMEEMVVSLKIFDWMTCRCGELLNLELEFNI